MVKVDGTDYGAIVTALTRNFEVVDGDNAGRTLAPVASHDIVVPFGNETLSFKAYVSRGSDDLLRQYSETNRYWGNLSFDFIAMEPQRSAV